MREYSVIKNQAGDDVRVNCFAIVGVGIDHDVLFEVANGSLSVKINNKENEKLDTEIAYLRLGQ